MKKQSYQVNLNNIEALKSWANPEPPEISGLQWQGRMLALINILTELGSTLDLIKHWDINLGTELSKTGINLMDCAGKLIVPNPISYPANGIEYFNHVTDLRCKVSNFADRLKELLTQKEHENGGEKEKKIETENLNESITSINIQGSFNNNETVQLGNNNICHNHKDSKKGIYYFITLLAALFACISYLLGWLEQIKLFILELFLNR